MRITSLSHSFSSIPAWTQHSTAKIHLIITKITSAISHFFHFFASPPHVHSCSFCIVQIASSLTQILSKFRERCLLSIRRDKQILAPLFFTSSPSQEDSQYILDHLPKEVADPFKKLTSLTHPTTLSQLLEASYKISLEQIALSAGAPKQTGSLSERTLYYKEWLEEYGPSITYLNCSNKDVLCIPNEITYFSNLKSLILGWNHIKVVPPTIQKLTNLKDLNLALNAISDLPELPPLTSLDINTNPFTDLPQSILSLSSSLTRLNLSSTMIEDDLEKLGQLPHLKTLGLAYCSLQKVPDSLKTLIHLEILNLSENFLTTLPPFIGNLSKLRSLFVKNNQLTFLPKTLGNLEYLSAFEAEKNTFDSVPKELYAMDIEILILDKHIEKSVPEDQKTFREMVRWHTP